MGKVASKITWLLNKGYHNDKFVYITQVHKTEIRKGFRGMSFSYEEECYRPFYLDKLQSNQISIVNSVPF